MKINFQKQKGIYLRQQINVTNRSKNNILCRYSNLFDPNSVLENNINIIKVQFEYNAQYTQLIFCCLGHIINLLVSFIAWYDR